jgi:hypothetical protein
MDKDEIIKEQEREIKMLEATLHSLEGAGSHHGQPNLSNGDIELLQQMIIWIETVREHGSSISYGKEWLPGYADMLKSRLFWRIRSGKNPLPHPPPTAFSCPWYEVVEEIERAHWVWQDVYKLGSHWPAGSVSVAQCVYEQVDQPKKDESGKEIEYYVSFGPYNFRVFLGSNKCTHFDNGIASLVDVEGWWIQRIMDNA